MYVCPIQVVVCDFVCRTKRTNATAATDDALVICRAQLYSQLSRPLMRMLEMSGYFTMAIICVGAMQCLKFPGLLAWRGLTRALMELDCKLFLIYESL